MRPKNEPKPVRVDQGVSPASVKLFPDVITAWAAGFDCLDGLAINDRGRRTGLSTDALAIGYDECVIGTPLSPTMISSPTVRSPLTTSV